MYEPYVGVRLPDLYLAVFSSFQAHQYLAAFSIVPVRTMRPLAHYSFMYLAVFSTRSPSHHTGTSRLLVPSRKDC